MSDAEIIKQCVRGYPAAQKALYDKYKVQLFILCQRYFPIRAEASDALQDGFIKVFRDLHQYDEKKGLFVYWIRRVFVNTCLEILRKKKVELSDINDHPGLADIHESILDTLQLRDLTKLIQRLSVGYRTVFNMYVIEGYSHSEIAEKLNISENTSKTQLMKAKNALRKAFEVVFK
jgi:RNA polymerase sigma factor (sigma-70 family)